MQKHSQKGEVMSDGLGGDQREEIKQQAISEFIVCVKNAMLNSVGKGKEEILKSAIEQMNSAVVQLSRITDTFLDFSGEDIIQNNLVAWEKLLAFIQKNGAKEDEQLILDFLPDDFCFLEKIEILITRPKKFDPEFKLVANTEEDPIDRLDLLNDYIDLPDVVVHSLTIHNLKKKE